MVCPKCQNKGFTPSKDFNQPIQNLGKKEHFMTFDTRRYMCLQCGHKWMTKEEFWREINLKNLETA